MNNEKHKKVLRKHNKIWESVLKAKKVCKKLRKWGIVGQNYRNYNNVEVRLGQVRSILSIYMSFFNFHNFYLNTSSIQILST